MTARKTGFDETLFSAWKETLSAAFAGNLRALAQRARYWRLLDDFEQTLPLLIVEWLIGVQRAMNMHLAIVIAREAQFCAKLAEVPAFLFGIHAQRDRRACGECGEVIIERRRCRALSAQRLRFVSGQIKMSGANAMQIVRFGRYDAGVKLRFYRCVHRSLPGSHDACTAIHIEEQGHEAGDGCLARPVALQFAP